MGESCTAKQGLDGSLLHGVRDLNADTQWREQEDQHEPKISISAVGRLKEVQLGYSAETGLQREMMLVSET